MNQNNPLARTSPPPARGKAREGVETPFLHCSTPIPIAPSLCSPPLKWGRNWYALIFVLFAAAAQAAPFADGDAEAGKKLFNRHQCNRCHISMMGGDGSAIFTRPNRAVTSPEKMVPRMKICSGVAGANLSLQDEQHLAAYLNRQHYQFK